MYQYIVLGLLFIPAYMVNEWIVVGNGLGIMKQSIADTGGSIVIHASELFLELRQLFQ